MQMLYSEMSWRTFLGGGAYLFIGEMNTQYIEYLHISFS